MKFAHRWSGSKGVSRVRLSGGAPRQIRIEVDPARLAERDLSLAAVRDAIRERNTDFSAGDLDSGKRRYLIRTVGRFDDLEDIRDLIVVRRGDVVVKLARPRHGHAGSRGVEPEKLFQRQSPTSGSASSGRPVRT